MYISPQQASKNRISDPPAFIFYVIRYWVSMILGTMVACVAGIHLVDWDFTGELEVEYKGLARTYSLLLPADYHHSQRQYMLF